MKVLVTGGAGFIGSHVVDQLVAQGDSVVAVDDLSTGHASRMHSAAQLVEHDLCEPGTEQLVSSLAPDVIVHAAAQVSVPASVLDPVGDADRNIIATIRVVNGAIRGGTRRIVYLASGGAMYGETASRPSREEDPVAPASPYGLSKWTAERYLSLIGPPSLSSVALRLANVYGPRQDASGEAGVVAIFLRKMTAGEPVEIHGDGEQVRDFVYVGDVVDAVRLALKTPATGPFNIATGKGTSIVSLFRLTVSLTGYSLGPTWSPPRQGDVRNSVLNPGRAAKDLGWSAAVSLRDGLARTLEAGAADARSPADEVAH